VVVLAVWAAVPKRALSQIGADDHLATPVAREGLLLGQPVLKGPPELVAVILPVPVVPTTQRGAPAQDRAARADLALLQRCAGSVEGNGSTVELRAG
jgi:hypothetical protein